MKKGQVVAYVEQLGTFAEIKAPQAGEVAKFEVEEGAAVEYGQVGAWVGGGGRRETCPVLRAPPRSTASREGGLGGGGEGEAQMRAGALPANNGEGACGAPCESAARKR